MSKAARHLHERHAVAEDEVVALEGRDRLARQTVAVEPFPARARCPARAVQIHCDLLVQYRVVILVVHLG